MPVHALFGWGHCTWGSAQRIPHLEVALRGVEEDVDGHALILVKLLGQKLAVDEPDGLVDVHSAVGVGLEDEVGSDCRSASSLRASYGC